MHRLCDLVFSNFTMTAVVNDSFKAFSGAPQGSGYAAGFTYKWQALSDTCGGVMIKSPTLMSTQMVLEDVGTSTLKLCVSDGEIARETILSLSASASTPQLIRQPSTSTIQVPAGTVDFAISVEGSSLPPPSYQWQQLVNVTVNRTSDVGNLTTRGVDYHSSYLATPQKDSLIFQEESLGMRTAMFASRGLMMAREEVEVEARSAPAQTIFSVFTYGEKQEFRSIPGATYGTLLVNGTEEWDGSVIRCLVYTTGGGTFTNNFTVVISEAIPSSTGGDSDAALIGGIVGGVGGGLLLCLLLLLVIAVVLMATRRRRATAYRKLKQPDYEEVAFGDVKGDVTLPKKQAEGYRQLEQLLANPDHRLALAICEVASIGERDAMYRALLRVLAGQFQAYNLIARTIKLEVASADEEGTLFRSNSAAAKLFTLYMRMIGLKYLFHVLVLSVRSLHDNAVDTNAASRNNQGAPSASSSSSRIFGHTYRIDRDDADGEESSAVSMDILGASSMELDPQKLDEASDLDINTLELWLTAQKMFKLIMQSEKILPQELRLLIRRIHDDVAEKFSDEAVFRAMGGSSSFASSVRHFLRPSCTAFSTSHLTPYLQLPARQMAQRQLILVTKVLQNLANDTLPGAKEAYMERLNAFIVSNKPALGRFYDQIVDHPDHGKLTDLTVPARVRNDALIKLRAFLEANLAGVEARLRDQGDDDEGDDVVQELRDILDKEPVSPIERV
ncbi:GTPase-activator protein for Ras family GTPase [Acanthamoeba castellanii str. Neff]|uniref:GTPase-activator protein for Ras family GTPase n=1 Tax=Acanthamoeba castellanii (strain ATCC 30010 / Neff) TaxID=1257118 RepID=L8HLD4_ACACF|nr:GTPase-activator protein for Ras family GTPase [Acanthamoeba castellanii str. Neff]ELR25191.1 GTPase-activator protein for Ras family GTPase [Acanthamoeba castellanii str. Neff]